MIRNLFPRFTRLTAVACLLAVVVVAGRAAEPPKRDWEAVIAD